MEDDVGRPSIDQNHFDLAENGTLTEYDLVGKNLLIIDGTREECTLLHIAAGKGYFYICKMLIDLEPKLLDQVDNDGWTALHYSVDQVHFRISSLLIEKKPALIWLRNDEGSPALHRSTYFSHWKPFKPVLETKWMQDDYHMTALHAAIDVGNTNVGPLLVTERIKNRRVQRQETRDSYQKIVVGYRNKMETVQTVFPPAFICL